MAHDLLSTKLRIPPQPQYIIHRPRLIDALEDAIPRHKLTLIAAPAGYGKTTLLAGWARTSQVPIAWVSLGADDNDLERFFRYLHAAWKTAQPGVNESPLGVLLGAPMPDRNAVLTAAINLANAQDSQIVFVLDDYHLIDDPAIHASLTFLLDHLPSTVHLVLAGRSEPPLPLARYRARREMITLDTADLRFGVEESDAFLNKQMGLELSDATIAALHAHLEGWIAGTQMLAITLRRQPRPLAEIDISPRHRFIADYLSQEVLDQLPAELHAFMLQTSILDRLSGPLCNAVTGDENGQEILETLEREHLFLEPLDDNREWYRYHRLFAEFLQEQLRRQHSTDLIANLHHNAAGWYFSQDMPEPAFEHAIAAGDLGRVSQIIDRYETFKLHSGELNRIRHWLESIPDSWYDVYPLFGLTRAALLAFTGFLDAFARSIDDVEQRLAAAGVSGTDWRLARVTAFRCYLSCFTNDLDRAETFANQALENLRDEDVVYRASIYHALGDTYSRNGRWNEAQAAYRTVLDHSQHFGARFQAAHVFGALADLELRRGHLRTAEGYWRRARDIFADQEAWGRIPLPVSGWIELRMGELRYERNDLTAARDHLRRGVERAELGGDARSIIAAHLLAARIALTEGDAESATQHLDQTRPLVEQASFPEWTSRYERLQVELWLAQDQLRAAVEWSDAVTSSGALHQRPEPEVGLLAIARVLVAKGDVPSSARALTMLGPLLQRAETDGRTSIQIEALALQALAHWQRGERANALASLGQSLRLAEPEAYLRLFADLGAPMARLLQEARSRDIMPDYAATLIAACATAATGEPTLLEPLTDREAEILALIAVGLTNAEIADRLFISPETVKKHASNIYGKLGTHTRTEAVARARAIRLLD